MKSISIRNEEGLLVYLDEDGKDCCLGDLLHFEGHGVFDPTYGRVDVSKEDAEHHNKILDEARLKGLDENCQIGQGGTFYLLGTSGETPPTVRTWLGTLVSNSVTINGKSITFYRDGKTYRGRLQKDADCFNFRRVF